MTPYLQQSVHICLHVRDGHPLHDDVSDTSLQRLPFGPGRPAEVCASHPHWGTPEEKDVALLELLKHTLIHVIHILTLVTLYLAPLDGDAPEACTLPGVALCDGSWGGSGKLTFLLAFPDTGLTCRLRAVT